jgi:hypothetical protein
MLATILKSPQATQTTLAIIEMSLKKIFTSLLDIQYANSIRPLNNY